MSLWQLAKRLVLSIIGCYCPICGRRFRLFAPLPSHFATNIVDSGWVESLDQLETLNHKAYACPICDATDRERLYALFLLGLFQERETPDPKRVLDFAPSVAFQDFMRREGGAGEYRTVDLFNEDMDDQADIMNLDIYDTGSFDIIVCSHVLEHVEDDCKAMSELFRVLRKGGTGVIMVPIDLKRDVIDEDSSVTDLDERWRRFGQDDHIRAYSKHGFVQRLCAAGFQVNELGVDYFGRSKFRRCGISSSSILYIVTKT